MIVCIQLKATACLVWLEDVRMLWIFFLHTEHAHSLCSFLEVLRQQPVSSIGQSEHNEHQSKASVMNSHNCFRLFAEFTFDLAYLFTLWMPLVTHVSDLWLLKASCLCFEIVKDVMCAVVRKLHKSTMQWSVSTSPTKGASLKISAYLIPDTAVILIIHNREAVQCY